VNGLRHDLRDALRGIAKNPGFSIVVVATLALGIGANTAIFSLFDQIALRRLPVERPEELVALDGPGPDVGRRENEHTFSVPMYRDFRDRNSVFSGVLARYGTSFTVADGGSAERVEGELVSGNYFEVLGVGAALGRTFTQADDRVPGGHPVAMLGYGYWRRRFAADPMVLNRTLTVNGHPLTVVGVAPPGFYGTELGNSPDVFVPLAMKAQMTPTWDDLDNRRSRWVNVLARLAPGVSREQAETAINGLYRQILEAEVAEIQGVPERFREAFVAKHLFVLPGAQGLSEMRRESAAPLAVLMGMVGLVLLIACANVANLLLARAQTRQRETALRLALGAGRARVVRQRLIESLLYSLAGGAAGLLLAAGGGELLLRALPAREGAELPISASPDLRVALFTAAVALSIPLIFGLWPALRASRPDLLGALKEDAGSVAGGRGHARFRRGLVTAQVALAVVLTAGAGMFAHSLANLYRVDAGFPFERRVMFSIDPSLSGYEPARSVALFDRLRDELAALPGVQGVTVAEIPVLARSSWRSTIGVEGFAPDYKEDMNPEVNTVGPDYFATLGIPLVAGRQLGPEDTADAPRVAVVNETFARYFFGEGNALGRRFEFVGDSSTIEIVGVVPDSRSSSLREEVSRAVWVPLRQAPADPPSNVTFYLRTAGSPEELIPTVRDTLRRVDPAVPAFDVKTLEAQAGESLLLDRLVALLSTLFGALATLLAAVGLYGVMSYSVARRTREIGIRMALGAVRPAIVRAVLREVALLAGIGLAVGLPIAYGFGRLVASQLYGLSGADPAVIVTVTVLLAAVALTAGFGPARRATRVDPLTALRSE
jgi:predicted permease